MLELGNPPYQTTGDLRTHCALIDAVNAAIPCLADWAKTTGHGETHKRDVDALRLCVMAIDALREEYSRTIQPERKAGEWPNDILWLIRPYQYTKPL
jgi:hypothetical protein